MRFPRVRFLVLTAGLLATGAAAQTGPVSWEPLPVVPGRPGTIAYDVAFDPARPLDRGGLLWMSEYGPLRYAPGDPGTWEGSDWVNLCTLGCAPSAGLLASTGTVLIASPAGSTVLDRLPPGGPWEYDVGPGGDFVFEAALPALRGPDGRRPLYVGTNFLYRSDDDGRAGSWEGVGDPGGRLEALAEVPPSGPLPDGRLLAAVWNGVTYSDDGGETWAPGAGAYGYARYIARSFAFVPEPGHPYGGAVLAGVDDLEWGRDSTATVYRSDDGGASWARLHRFRPSALGLANANGVELFAGPDGTVWAGVTDDVGGPEAWPGAIARSGDGGRTWAPAQDGYGGYRVRSVGAGPDGRLYVGSDVGVWRTTGPVFAVSGGAGPAPEAVGVGVGVAPNPAGVRATVTLRLSGTGRVRVTVVDALGREVAVVHDGPAVDGERFEIETSGLAPGVYRVRAATADRVSAAAALTVAR